VLTDRLADLDRQITDLTALRATVVQLRATVAVADPALADTYQVCPYLWPAATARGCPPHRGRMVVSAPVSPRT